MVGPEISCSNIVCMELKLKAPTKAKSEDEIQTKMTSVSQNTQESGARKHEGSYRGNVGVRGISGVRLRKPNLGSSADLRAILGISQQECRTHFGFNPHAPIFGAKSELQF